MTRGNYHPFDGDEQQVVAKLKGTDLYIARFRFWHINEREWWKNASALKRQDHIDWLFREGKITDSDMQNADMYGITDDILKIVEQYFDVELVGVRLYGVPAKSA